VRAPLCRAENVFDFHATREQGVSDQRAMASPRHGFSAHDRCAHRPREFQQSLERAAKFRRVHVIRVAAKGSIAPAEVEGVFFGVAQAPEFFQMYIADASGLKFCGQGVLVELRHAPRSWNGSHIHKLLNAVCLEDGYEFFYGSNGMADGQHD